MACEMGRTQYLLIQVECSGTVLVSPHPPVSIVLSFVLEGVGLVGTGAQMRAKGVQTWAYR